MSANHIFISHATADDDFVRDLRLALEGLGHAVWVDSRNLRGGDVLADEIENAICDARSFIAVLSPQTVNSPWVKKRKSIWPWPCRPSEVRAIACCPCCCRV